MMLKMQLNENQAISLWRENISISIYTLIGQCHCVSMAEQASNMQYLQSGNIMSGIQNKRLLI